jgi:hypothetical protein
MIPSPRDPAQFTRESADRIAAVVRSAELTPPSARPLNFEAVQTQRQQKTFRVCTFTGAWSKNSAKVVTFKNQTSTPNTVSATNLLYEIASSGTASTSRVCIVGKEGTAWYFVNEELAGCNDGSQKASNLSPSASESSNLTQAAPGPGVQVLVNDNGCVKWVGLQEITYIEKVRAEAEQIEFIRKKLWALGSVNEELPDLLGIDSCEP